ncbi:tRNA threonylcarbamoyladenosine dehydratase [Helicobacter himalayensis]|uniref:tRNA threonylcarbamoyladenosine dehydratase n=1 Tax=Helicobacter himalayensis TaxID=1591088 RepID=UPI000832FD66|nr:ThiF family adenylyltransferase [Helicobacter himalayensis]
MENEIIDRFTRSRLLFGEFFEQIQKTSVLILGVGGVGSFALDCLYRSGIGKLSIVDDDSFEVTNQNRQIGSQFVNEPKVKALARLYPGIEAFEESVSAEFLQRHNILQYDYVIDAIDDIPMKVEVAKIATQKPYGMYIASTGSAKKIDPLKIEVGSIWKSRGDKFARKFRDNLKKARVKAKFKVVFSQEIPKCKGLGSFSAVTGGFGLVIASQVIDDIITRSKK